MLKITLANGNEFEVLGDTACYPSMSTTARSYMEIHMRENEMPMELFYALMTDAEATKKIVIQNIDVRQPEKEYTNNWVLFITISGGSVFAGLGLQDYAGIRAGMRICAVCR